MDDNDILRDYLPWLRVVAGNMTGFDNPDLPDLVQEGYIAMWRALKSYKASAGPLDWWLKFKATSRMKTLVIRRPEKLDSDDETALEMVAAPDLLEQVEIAYHHGDIAEAISGLTPQQKKYVVARFWLGLSGREMVELGVFNYDPAALWNNTRNGAKWKLQKALSHLR